jgi:hypothetical protein
MSHTSLDIHCQHFVPHEIKMTAQDFSNFCTLELTICDRPHGDPENVTIFLPASMSKRLHSAVRAFNSEMSRKPKSNLEILHAEEVKAHKPSLGLVPKEPA